MSLPEPVDASPFVGLTAVSKLSLPDQVFNSLRDGLMSGRFPPGQRVPLRSMATALGTSTMPVREAVNRLVAMGALELLPNRRVSVPLLSAARYQEIATTRMIIESSAAEAATLLLSDEDLTKLSEIHREMRRQIDGAHTPAAEQEFLALNKQFHFLIYNANDSAILMAIIESLWLQVGPYLNLHLKDSRHWFTSDQHLPILKALKARVPQQVKTAMQENIDYATRFLLVNDRLNQIDIEDV